MISFHAYERQQAHYGVAVWGWRRRCGRAGRGRAEWGSSLHTSRWEFLCRLLPVQLLIVDLGVMRFLQTEWHRHERDRNAWEIEREEMKNRIAVLEGETRAGKGLRTSLERHVKLLEIALRKERERSRNLDKGEAVDTQKDPKEIARDEMKRIHNGKCLNLDQPDFH